MRLVPQLTDAQRAGVIASARKLRGLKFRHQGRTTRGIDCIGVLVVAFKGAGIKLKDRIDYGKLPANRKLAQSLWQHFGLPVKHGRKRIQPSDLQPGDIATMHWGDEECHVGLIVDHPHGVGMVHAYNNGQGVIEHGVDALWASRMFAVYRP